MPILLMPILLPLLSNFLFNRVVIFGYPLNFCIMKILFLDSYLQFPLSNGVSFALTSDSTKALRGTRETNNTNKEIAQLNNDWSERMYEKQEAYNREMYQRAYNDSTNYADKVAKLRAAGLNPALFFGSAGSGSTSALGVNPPTASEANRQIAPDSSIFSNETANLQNAVNGVSSAALGAAQVIGDNTLKVAQAGQVNQEAYFTPGRRKAEIYSLQQSGKSHKLQNDITDATKDGVVNSVFLNNELLRSNIDYQVQNTCKAKIESYLVQKEVDWFDRTKTQELAESSQRCALMVKQGQLTEEQAKTEIYKRLELSASAAEKRASAAQLWKMTDIMFETAWLDYDRKDEELNNLRKYGTTTPTNTVDTDVEGQVNGGFSAGAFNLNAGAKGSRHTRTYKRKQ